MTQTISRELGRLLICLLWLTALLSAAPQTTSSIQGFVKRAGSSEAISGVSVTLAAPETKQQWTVATDGQGRFGFDGLPFGRYTLRVDREGYFTSPEYQQLPRQIAAFTINTPQQQTFQVELVPGAIIAGRITDPEGLPLAGVGVSALMLQYDDGRRAFNAGSLPKMTDERGEFRLSWFPPGEYYVRAEYGRAETLARKSFYPGTVDSLAAAPLTIRGGENYEGIDFSLPRAQTVRISGQVLFDNSTPGGGVVRTFYLLPTDGRPSEVYPIEFVNSIGGQLGAVTSDFSFEARGVSPGLYDLAPFFIDSGRTYHTGRTPIQIRDQNIENIQAPIRPNVDVIGRITIRGIDSFRAWTSLHLQLRAKDVAIPLTTRSNIANVADDGTFTIRGAIEGNYQPYLGASSGAIPQGFYISEMRQGARDIRDDGTVDVRAGMQPLEIVLSLGSGRIRGVVEAPGGIAPPRADVVLIPQFSRRQNAMFFDRTVINAKGEFEFDGIAPGEYKIFAFERLPDSAERNVQFLAQYETLGTVAQVSSSSALDVRVRLLR
jgi:hypothetical protein